MKKVSLKKYLKATAIVQAYHRQMETEISEFAKKLKNSKPESKSKNDLQVGDYVECIEVHSNSRDNLIQGNQYEVKRVYRDHREEVTFWIRTEKGTLREYNEKNNQFKAI